MRPAQLRRFAATQAASALIEMSASMRPAQLRRFALNNPKVTSYNLALQ